ncbi:DUF2336 domain-containing protein [Brevundimonas sp.]|uniref:DUF2336 domain-containing protein n=1 Tax=Brevundimonas sp. TaxID=1871086 RepID=UPI003BABBC9C
MTAAASLQTFSARPAAPTGAARAAAVSPSDLLSLARSRTTDDRQRLLLALAAMCDATPPQGQVSPVMGEIFMALAAQAEHDIRRCLSESLASAEWAPPALINMLALDDIEIARPIIARSPLLQDRDLLKILVEATLEHHIEVARRPRLSGVVADAVIDAAEPATMTALASNRTAEISEDGLRRLVEQSRRIAALRAPLTRHPRLNDVLAGQLYSWVGQALRQAISERFRVDDASVGEAIDAAVLSVGPQRTPSVSVDEPNVAEREEMERRLVAKLQSAGQLRAGFLIRAIREKRLTLFEHGLATLGGFSVAQVRSAVMRSSPDALCLACNAVGIDRAVLPAVLDEVRKLTDGWPGKTQGANWAQMTLSPAAAAQEFRALIGAA